MKKSLALVAILCLFFSLLQAQDTPQISIQGTFKNANGMAIQDGTQQVTFRLYHENSGGSALWEETAAVEVVGGLYSHNLGSVTELNPDIFSSTVYLGIEVSGSELQPRAQLTYSPYTMFVQYAATAGRADNGVPAGTVLPFAGPKTKVPTGYLLCDGRSIVKTEYPDLFNAIGITYGGTSNGATFNLPDYRGIFLRGNDEGRGIDENRELGSLQQDATAMPENPFTGETDQAGAHTHEGVTLMPFINSGSSVGADYAASGSRFPWKTNPSLAGAHTHNVEISGGDSETRPVNMSVNYMIKY
ncbi:MAG: phage tail protein [Phaeodactylibacter xiamenensis]|uniref:phage tail protein n=1 Tax=Phaeodactylibacter xiamenensis TaxID=1524460 RepID=UPI000698ECEC|nr:phage tail protein [Phaeodactylibacter xiamenensis]MCR9053479.1 phage tail protein [bacterium]